MCFPSISAPHSVASYPIPHPLSSLENTKREPCSLNSGVSPSSSARKLIRKARSSKMNKAVELKTHLNAECRVCYLFLLLPQSRGEPGGQPGASILRDWERAREILVGKTGSLCFATRSQRPSFRGKKSESI